MRVKRRKEYYLDLDGENEVLRFRERYVNESVIEKKRINSLDLGNNL